MNFQTALSGLPRRLTPRQAAAYYDQVRHKVSDF
jgi:hypothetical protein